MRRIVAAVLVTAFLTVSVLGEVATAHTFVATTSLGINKAPGGSVKKGTTVVIYGKLKSSKALCREDQVVRLMKARSGDDKLLAKDRTDAEGEYLFVRTAKKDMKVYTKFKKVTETSYGHSHTCKGSKSKTIKINVK
jgi:hypothetical protein